MNNLINKQDKIFLAGHNGMVGSAIKRILTKSEYGQKSSGGSLLTKTRKELDLLDIHSVEDFFSRNQPEVVIIAAAKVGGILANKNYPFEFLSENIKIQQNLIETSFKYKVRRLLFLGSSCIYPKFADQPIKEEELLTKSLEKTNEWYAIAKICGIKLCESLRKQYNFDAICLMPTNIYGPGDNYHPENSHVFASLIRKFIFAKKNKCKSVECWGTGKPFREFLHAEDLGYACLHALEKWDPSLDSAPRDNCGEPLTFLNVGTGKDISIKELALMISKEVGFEGEIIWNQSKPDGTPKKLLDTSRISSLGWEPKIDLLTGIRNTLREVYDEF